ncbi:hypothetical protein BKE38_10210 [Pseudoroseomonas deserti]|uniref:Uncharacterized protein n=1 Tax=Teichococcus deserti TaxID=1817963 RepID=A0A1V2H368_9PROT|nr:hypothetical protein [Pseudoroseomonas deserti]ONG54453.1 hypothetical protein BKE38_10210 [Pseudoroseomonas deserti]
MLAGPGLAAWLPRGQAMRERMATEARLAEAAAEEARRAVTQARTNERVVELAREAREAEEEKRLGRKTQAALDEMASRKKDKPQ